MTPDPTTVPADVSLFGAFDLMQRHDVRRLPVLDANGALVGILTRSDILRTTAFSPGTRADAMFALAGLTVADAMTPRPITVSPEYTIAAVAACMREHHISGVPVVAGNRVVGILTESDIFRMVAQAWTTADSDQRLEETYGS